MASDDNKTQSLDLFGGRHYEYKQGDRQICVGTALTLLGNYLFNRDNQENRKQFDAYAVTRCLEEHVRDVFWKIILGDLQDGPKTVPTKIASVEDYLRQKIYLPEALPVAVENMAKQEWEKGGGDDHNWKYGTLKDYLCAETDGIFQRESSDGELVGYLNKLLNGIVEAILLGQDEQTSLYVVQEAFFPCDGKEPKFGFIPIDAGCEHQEKGAGACRKHDCNKCRKTVYKLFFVESSFRNTVEMGNSTDMKTGFDTNKIPMLLMIPEYWIHGGKEENKPNHMVLATGYSNYTIGKPLKLVAYNGARVDNETCEKHLVGVDCFHKVSMDYCHQPVLMYVKRILGTKKAYEESFDVFISYRSSSSEKLALYVYEQLKQDGFSVYKAGKEDNGEQADIRLLCLELVLSAKIILLILSKDCLEDRASDTIFYKEIEYAFKGDKTVFLMLDKNESWDDVKPVLAKIIGDAKGKKQLESDPIFNPPPFSPWLLKFNKLAWEKKVNGTRKEEYYKNLSPEQNIAQKFEDMFIETVNKSLFTIVKKDIEINNKIVTSISGWILKSNYQDSKSRIPKNWIGGYILLAIVHVKPIIATIGDVNQKKPVCPSCGVEIALTEKKIHETIDSISFQDLRECFQKINSDIFVGAIKGYCTIFISDEYFSDAQVLLSNGLKLGVRAQDGFQYKGKFPRYYVEENKGINSSEVSECPGLSQYFLNPVFNDMFKNSGIKIEEVLSKN